MEKNRMKQALAALLFASFAAAAGAQPLVSTFPTLSTDGALKVAQVAFADCQKQGYVVAVAVVDRGGAPLALLRDNLAGAHTPNTAIGKAWTAVSFRTNSTDLLAMTEPGKPSAGIRGLPNVVALGGGMMIRAKGVLVGGIGVSGAPSGTLDDDCAKAGIKAIQDSLELD
jgi:uncharacterized protein GlcG (DUF336 family)